MSDKPSTLTVTYEAGSERPYVVALLHARQLHERCCETRAEAMGVIGAWLDKLKPAEGA